MDISLYKTVLPAAVLLLDFVAIAVLVWRAQGVERTLAWLFAIIAFPGIGTAAFFLFANPSVRRASRIKRVLDNSIRQSCSDKRGLCATQKKLALFTLAESATHFKPSTGNQVELLADNEHAFSMIEKALMEAKDFIWVEYYIIRRDETGSRFLEILADRARQGVEVRLIYDAIGSMGLDGERIEAIREGGGKAEAFHPLNPLKRRWSVHLRNHRKLVVVDGRIAFTGGMNVGDEYSGRSRRRGGLYFHDTHTLIRGPAVFDLAEVFAQDWAFATGETLAIDFITPAQEVSSLDLAILPSGPDQERNASALLYFGLLGQAQKSAYLTSPYFIPDEPMLYAIQCAAMRGVDVKILVPAKGDMALVSKAARSYYPSVLRSGAKVYEYLPSMLHAKTAVVDGLWCIVGSANLDIRSFRLNFELGILVRDADLGQRLESRFFRDVKQSRELNAETIASQGVWDKVTQRAARLVSPLL